MLFARDVDVFGVAVDFGYDPHSLLIAKRAFARLQAGIPVTLRGQGFWADGALEEDP